MCSSVVQGHRHTHTRRHTNTEAHAQLIPHKPTFYHCSAPLARLCVAFCLEMSKQSDHFSLCRFFFSLCAESTFPWASGMKRIMSSSAGKQCNINCNTTAALCRRSQTRCNIRKKKKRGKTLNHGSGTFDCCYSSRLC